MNRLMNRFVLSAALILTGALGACEKVPLPAISLACPNPAAGCTTTLAQQPVRVRFEGPLRTLKPFQVRVEAPGFDDIEADFTMPGMNMGFNRYTLKRDAAGQHHAQVLLPTCISGRGDWVMTLVFDGRERLSLAFDLKN